MTVIFTAMCHTVFGGLYFPVRSTYCRSNRALVKFPLGVPFLQISKTVGFTEFLMVFRYKTRAKTLSIFQANSEIT